MFIIDLFKALLVTFGIVVIAMAIPLILSIFAILASVALIAVICFVAFLIIQEESKTEDDSDNN